MIRIFDAADVFSILRPIKVVRPGGIHVRVLERVVRVYVRPVRVCVRPIRVRRTYTRTARTRTRTSRTCTRTSFRLLVQLLISNKLPKHPVKQKFESLENSIDQKCS